ncbi:hypothetical protein [Streptomyces sp. PBH53]|uniref:hypothetical protein n=1 Tax=Streptomyces sp. PBH53 TaxID=1577075 RepID=UPI001AD80928|nr:hypothetical protein [Streptomyces sp. PBH53]
MAWCSPPLRRTGRGRGLHLLDWALTHLTAGLRPTAAELEAADMAALTAAYATAQAHRSASLATRTPSAPRTGAAGTLLSAVDAGLAPVGSGCSRGPVPWSWPSPPTTRTPSAEST